MKVYLVRRWGARPAGGTVDVDDTQGRWLLDHHFATRSKDDTSNTAGAVAPGTDGPDPLAGGDATRRYPATRRGNRDGNLALPVPGSPVAYTSGVAPGAGPALGSDRGPEPRQAPSAKVTGRGRKTS